MTIYLLWDYEWLAGELISTGRSNYKVRMPWQSGTKDRYFPKDRCAFADEQVCVVWETWRGTNGRGGYRVERERYPELRVAAQQVSRQHPGGVGRVTELELGQIE